MGALDSILGYQADLLDGRENVKGKIKTALTYPAVMCVVGTGVLIFLITYVVPMVTRIFDRMNQQLPLPTQVLMAVTNFVNSYIFRRFSRGCHSYPFLVDQEQACGQAIVGPVRPAGAPFGRLYQMILIGRFAQDHGGPVEEPRHMLQSLVVVSSTMKNSIFSDAVIKYPGWLSAARTSG